MNPRTPLLIAWLLLTPFVARAVIPLPLSLTQPPEHLSYQAWPVMSPLPAPEGLRPCCAFGYNLHAQLLGIAVPFYQLDNVMTPDSTGYHHYNDSLMRGLINLMGIGDEHNGIIYTSHGGFIDTAHVRDSADMTVYLFSQLQARLGQTFRLQLSDELARRQIQFRAFTPPPSAKQRYALSAWLAARLAFQLAAWHEIAQWYGFESVPGFPEGVSAFSPEDLYSNLLGTRIAVALILTGQTASREQYDSAMAQGLHEALIQLGGQPASATRFHFDMLDGRWWNSRRRLPEKYLVRQRNYSVSDQRFPTPVPGEQAKPWRLSLPHRWQHYRLEQLAQLQLLPGKQMARLARPKLNYRAADFPRLASYAQRSDSAYCHAWPGRC
ncbi:MULTISPECIES: DUF4056 domain-containing protein [unclassified Erwinia]|uniref:DUF4056 domain-containing protein n=1 Tax=unclassified Erwinia TaxID=2622719 RepID=UPI001F52BF71|nr:MULTISPECIES: DUF4056 domain-containing protein [unclassified Erwinia]